MIDKVKTMYKHMVERYSASAYTPFQAEVYRKILALADECDMVQTMTRRMQNEGYNAMPTVAIVQDKLIAYHKAAVDNGLDEHAALSKKALDNLITNPNDVFLTGYYDDIRNASHRYAQTLHRLLDCFDDFLHYEVKKEAMPNLDLRYNEWKKEGISLNEIVTKKVFRKHLACSDSFLNRFVNEYERFVTSASSSTETETSMQNEAQAAWDVLKEKDAQRKVMAQTELPKFRLASAMCVAPYNADGDYEYIHVEFENS